MNKASPEVIKCHTLKYAHYSVKHSPFYQDRLAVATSQNFGLVGNGRLHVCRQAAPFRSMLPAQNALRPEIFFDTQDGLYDLAWSELHENQLATVSGDGSIKLWDITLKEFPIARWKEHSREIYCIDWNNLNKAQFATCSWDHSIKIWTPDRPTSLQTINQAHQGCVYNAIYAPNSPSTIASCSADGQLSIWDLNSPRIDFPALTAKAHPTEILSLDWNKYQPFYIATGSVDRSIKIHDLRMLSNRNPIQSSNPNPSYLTTLLGHQYAIRKVAFSPHSANLLASASYDMTARIWDINFGMNQTAGGGLGAVLPRKIYDGHSEFVVGLSWSLFEQGVLASCSWDMSTHLWSV